MNFEDISVEMADDLYEGIARYEAAKKILLQSGAKERIRAARELLGAQKEMSDTANAIYETIWTVPMMVHTAGPAKDEQDDQGNSYTVQRCSRCGSVLQSFNAEGIQAALYGLEEAEDLPWWTEGDLVAKSGDSDYKLSLYLIEDRDLEPFEYECVDLNELSKENA